MLSVRCWGNAVGERHGHPLDKPGKRNREPGGAHERNRERDREEQAGESASAQRWSIRTEGDNPDAIGFESH